MNNAKFINSFLWYDFYIFVVLFSFNFHVCPFSDHNWLQSITEAENECRPLIYKYFFFPFFYFFLLHSGFGCMFALLFTCMRAATCSPLNPCTANHPFVEPATRTAPNNIKHNIPNIIAFARFDMTIAIAIVSYIKRRARVYSFHLFCCVLSFVFFFVGMFVKIPWYHTTIAAVFLYHKPMVKCTADNWDGYDGVDITVYAIPLY